VAIAKEEWLQSVPLCFLSVVPQHVPTGQLTNVDAGEYKAGLKAISQLIGEGGLTGKETVRIADIEQVLSLEVSRPALWSGVELTSRTASSGALFASCSNLAFLPSLPVCLPSRWRWSSCVVCMVLAGSRRRASTSSSVLHD
jgi:hypothetical protein